MCVRAGSGGTGDEKVCKVLFFANRTCFPGICVKVTGDDRGLSEVGRKDWSEEEISAP